MSDQTPAAGGAGVDAAGTGGGQTVGNGLPWRNLFLVAVAIAVVYGVFAAFGYSRAGNTEMTDTVWSRSVFVLQGIEAIALTAVGWLFGREVHRGEADTAKQSASEAQRTAAQARDEAARARSDVAQARQHERETLERAAAAETAGWRLAEAVRSRPDRGGAPPEADGGNERAAAGPGVVDPTRALADRLFPPA